MFLKSLSMLKNILLYVPECVCRMGSYLISKWQWCQYDKGHCSSSSVISPVESCFVACKAMESSMPLTSSLAWYGWWSGRNSADFLFSFLDTYLSIHLFERWSYRVQERQRFSICWFISQNGDSSQNWGLPKPECRSFFWVSHVGAWAQELGHLLLSQAL